MFPIHEGLVREWLLDVFPSIPFEEKTISTVGSGPYDENDFDLLFRESDVEVYNVEAGTEILIVGRDFAADQVQKERFNEMLDRREGESLRVYSQEMFLAHWFSAQDPFDDEDVAIAFRDGHPGLEYVSSQWMEWANTVVNPKGGGGEIYIDAPDTGVLGYLGYRVGKTKGLPVAERRKILADVFTGKIPNINSREYMEGWGLPNSMERLKKMADSMATFCRNQKLAKNHVAAKHYDEDLEWLKQVYYTGRFRFRWAEFYVDQT